MRLIQYFLTFILIMCGLGLMVFVFFSLDGLLSHYGPTQMERFVSITGILLGIFVLVLLFTLLFRMLANRERPQSLAEEESQLLRQIWETQDRMEQRITHLEAILLERGK